MIPAKKSLGQNFLRNIGALSSIVRAAGDVSHKTVLEIGPGLGDLTNELLSHGAIVTAVEKDARLIPH
jgi:16S rRNA (adenine1518-N6/adenine1519-N6)-dimethyltransferase